MDYRVRNPVGETSDQSNCDQTCSNERQRNAFVSLCAQENKSSSHAHKKLGQARDREEFHGVHPRGVDVRIRIDDPVRSQHGVAGRNQIAGQPASNHDREELFA